MDAVALTSRELLVTLAGQIGVDPAIESLARQELGHFTWDFYSYEYQGLVLDLALAEESGKAYMVLLATNADEHPFLYQAIFMPVVKALAPIE